MGELENTSQHGYSHKGKAYSSHFYNLGYKDCHQAEEHGYRGSHLLQHVVVVARLTLE